MIFKPEMVDKILAGQKTVTRRPVKYELDLTWGQPPIRRELALRRYEVGQTYAVQPGRGQRAVARIRVLDYRRVLLGSIDDREAQCEGFQNRDAFITFWLHLYRTFNSTQLVDRIEFELVPDEAGGEG